MRALQEEDAGGRVSAFASARRCTDLLFLVLFALAWVLFLVIAGVGFANGEPEALLFGTDHAGRVCGGSEMRGAANIFYPRLQQDLIDAYASDPDRFDPSQGGDPLDVTFYGVCVDDCPQRGDVIDNGDSEAGSPWAVTQDTDMLFFRCFSQDAVERNTSVLCLAPQGPAYEAVSCEPEDCEAALQAAYPGCTQAITASSIAAVAGAKSDPLYDQLNTWYAILRQHIGAVELAGAEIFLAGVVVAGAISLVWVLALRHCAGCMVWLTLLCLVLVEVVSALYFLFKAGVLDQEALDMLQSHQYLTISDARLEADQSRAELYRGIGYSALCLTVITLCLIAALRSRILMSVGLIKEAARALTALPGLLLFPVGPVLLGAGLVAFFVLSTAYVATSGSVSAFEVGEVLGLADANTTWVSVSDESDLGPAFIGINAFGFVWSLAVLKAAAVTTVAGAVAQFYWAPEAGVVRARFPVARALYTTTRYHLGTLCLGGLIIALVQAARSLLAYLDRKTRNLQRTSSLVRAVMCALSIYLWCFEKVVKFISKNAYCVVAVQGTSFCESARTAFQLLLANAVAVATLDMLVHVLVLFGKLVVAVTCTMILFYRIHDAPDMPSPLMPVLLTLLLAYTVSSLFFGVYLAGVDTIVLSFCMDKRLNGTTGDFFMPDSLRAHLTSSASVDRPESASLKMRALSRTAMGRLGKRPQPVKYARAAASSDSDSDDAPAETFL